MLKAITFDFWDTLYKFTPDARTSEKRVVSLRRFFMDLGYELTDEKMRDVVQQVRDLSNDKQRHEGLDMAPREQINYILNEFKINLGKQDWDKLYQLYTSYLLKLPPRLNEGVLETLPVLARYYKLAVICNTGVTPGAILREIMQKDQIYDYFQLTVFSDEMTWAKPNPRIFNFTLQQLQVSPSEAAHIGDDSLTDVLGSKNAGMTSIWLASADSSESRPECDYRVSSVRDLLELFKPNFN